VLQAWCFLPGVVTVCADTVFPTTIPEGHVVVVEVACYFRIWLHCGMPGPGALLGDASFRLGAR
jgi:hypothetical protein